MSQFERPCRAEYPEDWLASYTKEYTSIVQKGDGFLLVLDLKSANETVGFIAGSPSSGWSFAFPLLSFLTASSSIRRE